MNTHEWPSARPIDVSYVFTEPWRYMLKVTPHIVTHVKLIDVDIERELAYIKNHIDDRKLAPRINSLTRGRGYRRHDPFCERATPAYLVSGKGQGDALYSASHGAGRAMSRQKAKDSMTVSAMKKLLTNAGVTLIGGTVEENPLAYKDIETVIAAQNALVNIQGRFFPRLVRMNKE